MPERPSYFDDKVFIPWPTTREGMVELARLVCTNAQANAELLHDFPEFRQQAHPTPAPPPSLAKAVVHAS